ncbi:MAG: acyl carrier protein [Nitrospirae bacterium]|nr:acyl carrier protein [Nitrospirota bacterium]
MAPDAAIADRIRTALAHYLKRDASTIQPHHALREDLGLDSMATIELLFRIEEAFDFQIPDEDLQKLATVADVIAYVEGRLKPSPPTRAAKRTTKRLPVKKKG